MGARVSVIYLTVVHIQYRGGSGSAARDAVLYVIILGIYNIQNVVA